MATEKITTVQFRKNGLIREIPLEGMTGEFYSENKEFIFCPNPKCDANIEYCNGPRLTYYRSSKSAVNGEEIIKRHIEECPYGLEHDTVKTPKVIYDSSKGQLISDDHISKSLDRVFKQYKDPNYGKPKPSQGSKKKRKSRINTDSDEKIIRGKGIIGVNEEENERKPHEPPLYQRHITEIGERDFNTSRIVKGLIKEIRYNENYVSIILDTENNLKARIYFSENFKDNNETQFNQLRFYEQYVSTRNGEGEEVFVACAGDVKKDSYGISIYVMSYKHLTIDGMKHYNLLRSMGLFQDKYN